MEICQSEKCINWNKKSLDGLITWMKMKEERISEFKEISIEIIQSKWQTENNLRDLWNKNQRSDIDVLKVPETEEKEYGTE